MQKLFNTWKKIFVTDLLILAVLTLKFIKATYIYHKFHFTHIYFFEAHANKSEVMNNFLMNNFYEIISNYPKQIPSDRDQAYNYN